MVEKRGAVLYNRQPFLTKRDKKITFSKKNRPLTVQARMTVSTGSVFFIYSVFLVLIFYTLANKYSGHLVPALLLRAKLFRCIQDSTHNTGKIPPLNS
jgi:hypothetical protein